MGWLRTVRVTLARVLAVGMVAWAGTAAPAQAEPPAVVRPSYQVGNDTRTGGTAFFLDTPEAGVVAVAAAHSFGRGELARAGAVEFLLGSGHRAARATRFVRSPGLPFSAPGGTVRDDLALFMLEAPPRNARALKPGLAPRPGERVRILGIPSHVSADEDDIYGRVSSSGQDQLEVDLDVTHDLRGWGGAPLLEATSGLVIGVLQAASKHENSLRIVASPISAVLDAARRPGDGVPFEKATSLPDPRVSAATPVRSKRPAAPGRSTARRPRAPRKVDGALLSAEELRAGASPMILDIEYPTEGAILGDEMGAFVAGQALAPLHQFRSLDVMFVIDTSHSTIDPSGADVNGNGKIGRVSPGGLGGLFGLGQVDRGDSILAAEVAAARRFISRLDARSTRVGIVTFAGESIDDSWSPDVRNPATTVVPLTHDYDRVQAGLDGILKRGPRGQTHMGAGADQATKELLGLERLGALSEHDPDSEKVVIFLTDGQPTLPYPGDWHRNVRSVLNAANRASRKEIRFFTFGIGPQALEGPVAIVRLAEITEGTFTPVRDPAKLGDVIEGMDFANVESLDIVNTTNGAEAWEVITRADGNFSALVPLEPGQNVLRVSARATDGREITREVTVEYAPGTPDPNVPRPLLASRNELLERRLISIKRGRIEIEKQQAEQTRRELELEIQQERAKAAERAERQRKELELEVERDTAP